MARLFLLGNDGLARADWRLGVPIAHPIADNRINVIYSKHAREHILHSLKIFINGMKKEILILYPDIGALFQ